MRQRGFGPKLLVCLNFFGKSDAKRLWGNFKMSM